MWAAIGGFVLWTSIVAYSAFDYGANHAEQACQEERNRANAAKALLEVQHAQAARKFEEERKHDQQFIERLRTEHKQVAKLAPLPADCRLGPERVRLWNEANAGADVSGEPPGDVPRRVPGTRE